MAPKRSTPLPPGRLPVTTVTIEHVRIPCRHGFAAAQAALEQAVPRLDTTFRRHQQAHEQLPRPSASDADGHGETEAGPDAAPAEPAAGRPSSAVRAALAALPPLSRFGRVPRDLGSLLRPVFGGGGGGGVARVLQYEIGNPLTAVRMLRHAPGVALYAPVRVLLWEAAGRAASPGRGEGEGGVEGGGEEGEEEEEEAEEEAGALGRAVFFEFDRPASTMGQFGEPDVDRVAAELDRELTEVLVRAAGWEWFGQWKGSKSRL